MNSTLSELLERAETWPKEAQAELLRAASEIERGHAGVYVLNAEERAAIEIGLKDMQKNRFAKPAEIEALFAKCRS
ncbi:MAG: hypothetical protein Q8L53_00900 [Aestuariivirga sp.]|nr:hypothetical protein [Aestuariivirga sp.]